MFNKGNKRSDRLIIVKRQQRQQRQQLQDKSEGEIFGEEGKKSTTLSRSPPFNRILSSPCRYNKQTSNIS